MKLKRKAREFELGCRKWEITEVQSSVNIDNVHCLEELILS